MTDDPTTDPGRGGAGGEGPGLVRWPPPELARLQGELWRVIAVGALGALILVGPLLWAVATEREFWSLGAFGQAWWMVLVTTLLGLLLLAAAYRGLHRLFGRAADAADAGYGRLTILEVVSDFGRDTGFLIQGARHYSALDTKTRNRLVGRRILGGVAYLGAALWVPLGFTVAVLAAARGVGSPAGVWLVAFLPAGLLLLAGFAARILEKAKVKAARVRWVREAGIPAWLEDEVQEWLSRFRPVARGLGLEPGRPDRGLAFRTVAVAVVVLFFLVAIPVISLAFTTALGPQVANLAVPDLVEIQEDAAGVEAMRRFELAEDPDISPREAGEALHSLVWVGRRRDAGSPLMEPVRTHEEPWFPEDPEGLGPFFPSRWTLEVLERAPEGLADVEVRYLERLASHPAQLEMATLARAGIADVAGTRWRLPFPDSLTLLTLPIPSYGSVRDAGYARVGRAALELSRGGVEEAEESLREIVSSGFFLMEEGPILTDALVGMALVETGADALEILFRATGREEEARGVRWARSSTARAASLGRVGRTTPDIQALVKEMSETVVRPSTIRGLRWDLMGGFHTLSPCINTHKVFFGPGGDYERWLADAREGLVRFPSEEELFRLARGGWLGSVDVAAPGWMTRLLMVGLGGRRAPGSCTTLVAGMG